MSFRNFKEIQFVRGDETVDCLEFYIYSEQLKGEYGGAVGQSTYDSSNTTTLKLRFSNYNNFLDFYNAVIAAKKGIDDFREKEHIED